MAMRYHFGLGIGHTYSHAHLDLVSTAVSSQRPHSNNMGDDASHVADSERMPESLESEPSDIESDSSSPDGSDSELDERSEESDSESALGNYVDMDGWNDVDMDLLNRYEF